MESLERILKSFWHLALHGHFREIQERGLRAGLDALQGRRSEAVEGFRHAAAGYADVGARFEEALNGIGMLATLGPADPDARAEAIRVRPVLEEIGAAPLLDRLDALLRESPQVAAGDAAPAARPSAAELETAS